VICRGAGALLLPQLDAVCDRSTQYSPVVGYGYSLNLDKMQSSEPHDLLEAGLCILRFFRSFRSLALLRRLYFEPCSKHRPIDRPKSSEATDIM
jgi:hypothetical protein